MANSSFIDIWVWYKSCTFRIFFEICNMGTGYAIWTGIGVVGGTFVGMVFYGESRDWRRPAFIALILFSTIGLKLVS